MQKYSSMRLRPDDIVKIVKGAARRLKAKISKEACRLIADHTIEGKKKQLDFWPMRMPLHCIRRGPT